MELRCSTRRTSSGVSARPDGRLPGGELAETGPGPRRPRMGDWMTVMIEGTCDPAEVAALTEYLTAVDWTSDEAGWDYGPLTISDGLCGLGGWPAATILRIGNCYERDFTPEDVADHLRRCAAVAPSLAVKAHCGGPYESLEVRATVTLEGGEATVGDPEREQLPPIPEEQMAVNFLKALSK